MVYQMLSGIAAPGVGVGGGEVFVRLKAPSAPPSSAADSGPPSQEKAICLRSEGVDRQRRGDRSQG